ncbi:MAG: hypothetical protein JWN98_1495 [Abditibacteriota bacterium]|nr:hypothetical protein [Abditibacteriota bacterium]
MRCNQTSRYVVDSLPIPVCDNIRIKHCNLLAGPEKESYRGCVASKHRFFFGLKVHLVVTGRGKPIEFVITSVSCSDIKALKSLDLDLPAGSLIHADRAYNDYSEEDLLLHAAGITLQLQRKKNSKRRYTKSFCSSRFANKSKSPLAKSLTCFPSIFMLLPLMGLCLKSSAFCSRTVCNAFRYR